MRRGVILLVIFLVVLLAPSGMRYVRYYNILGAERPTPPVFQPAAIAAVPTPSAHNFTDEPEVGQGYVLLDRAHENDFTLDEIGYLDGRLAARGFELLPFTGEDMATALRSAAAFVVITPQNDFTLDEVQAVSDYVARGGRLLLVGDPTRFTILIEENPLGFSFELESDELPLNTLANAFDIIE